MSTRASTNSITKNHRPNTPSTSRNTNRGTGPPGQRREQVPLQHQAGIHEQRGLRRLDARDQPVRARTLRRPPAGDERHHAPRVAPGPPDRTGCAWRRAAAGSRRCWRSNRCSMPAQRSLCWSNPALRRRCRPPPASWRPARSRPPPSSRLWVRLWRRDGIVWPCRRGPRRRIPTATPRERSRGCSSRMRLRPVQIDASGADRVVAGIRASE